MCCIYYCFYRIDRNTEDEPVAKRAVVNINNSTRKSDTVSNPDVLPNSSPCWQPPNRKVPSDKKENVSFANPVKEYLIHTVQLRETNVFPLAINRIGVVILPAWCPMLIT